MRKDLFKIASEADRCLENHGVIVITDFQPPFPYKNAYSHHEDVYSYKMNYSQMFSWNPAYVEMAKAINHTASNPSDNPDARIGTSVLRKDHRAYVADPFATRCFSAAE